MDAGHSWSGRERNNGYLNLGTGRFVDASSVTGLDFADDGRAVASTDWDSDGDLDLILRNRTGPQVRLMINRSRDTHRAGHFISFKLAGSTVNRDAIGARVTVHAGERHWMRELVAGDGYLSHSSRWLHFGLGAVDRIDRVTIHWPGAEVQELNAPEVDRHYVVKQGEDAKALTRRDVVRLEDGALDLNNFGSTCKTVLRTPLPAPPTLRPLVVANDVKTDDASLLLLWASWCPACLDELATCARNDKTLRDARLRVFALNVDDDEHRASAREQFKRLIAENKVLDGTEFRAATKDERTLLRLVLEHIVGSAEESLPLPVSLLVDARGFIQVVYFGPQSPKELADDARRYCHEPPNAAFRSAWPGRWYFRTRRNLESLGQSLEEASLKADATFYRKFKETERTPGDR